MAGEGGGGRTPRRDGLSEPARFVPPLYDSSASSSLSPPFPYSFPSHSFLVLLDFLSFIALSPISFSSSSSSIRILLRSLCFLPDVPYPLQVLVEEKVTHRYRLRRKEHMRPHRNLLDAYCAHAWRMYRRTQR
eukprot:GHVU01011242.1.p1 GENE.GHVU01011242.1~~GHVU01011242.1.p1  ORF type:complete len:133 (-),score=16.48 GHVU01011242.1:77-475(-)